MSSNLAKTLGMMTSSLVTAAIGSVVYASNGRVTKVCPDRLADGGMALIETMHQGEAGRAADLLLVSDRCSKDARFEDALAILLQAHAVAPSDKRVALSLVEVLVLLGRFDEAHRYYVPAGIEFADGGRPLRRGQEMGDFPVAN